MHVVILGMPGSGKTTVSELLSRRLHVPRVASGDIARRMATVDPHTAVALEQGKMAPEESMRMETRRALEAADLESGGWILDGFPRDLAQLVCLMDWTPALPAFVHLDASEWTVIERLTSRRRDDDTPDAIARRILDHQVHVRPVLDALASGRVLIQAPRHLDPDQTADYVEGAILR